MAGVRASEATRLGVGSVAAAGSGRRGKGKETVKVRGLVMAGVVAAMATVMGVAWVAVAPCRVGSSFAMEVELYRAEVVLEGEMYRAAVETDGDSGAAVAMVWQPGGDPTPGVVGAVGAATRAQRRCTRVSQCLLVSYWPLAHDF